MLAGTRKDVQSHVSGAENIAGAKGPYNPIRDAWSHVSILGYRPDACGVSAKPIATATKPHP